MAREFAKAFYGSREWYACKESYIKARHGLCERCLAKGLYNPGKIVHHKIYLTPDNIRDPRISLNHANLELLCQECHNVEHTAKRGQRYLVDAAGNVSQRPTPPGVGDF